MIDTKKVFLACMQLQNDVAVEKWASDTKSLSTALWSHVAGLNYSGWCRARQCNYDNCEVMRCHLQKLKT